MTKMDQEPDLSEPPYMPTPEEEKAEAWEYWHQRARRLEAALHQIAELEPSTQQWVDGHPVKDTLLGEIFLIARSALTTSEQGGA